MKPRILFLIPGLSVGGAERHTVDLRARLEARGYPTGLIVHGRRRSEALASHPGAAGAVFLGLKGMSDPVGWRRVRQELQRQAPDVIVAVNQMPLIVAVVSRLMLGTRARIACVFHTTILRSSETRLFFLFRWTLRLADALVFVSADQKAYWTSRNLKSRRLPVILNGIDLALFEAAPRERAETRARLGFADQDLVIGLVAAFRPEKNHLSLIDALAILRQRGVRAKVLLVGDGPTRVAVQVSAEAQGVQEHVVFTGEQVDVRPFMAASDVGVLCSVAVETFSLSALEFLAMGVPMVMSRVGGASEIVEHGVNGLLFDVGRTDDMANCLQRLADLSARRTMVEATRPSMMRLSIQSMVQAYEDLFAILTVNSAKYTG